MPAVLRVVFVGSSERERPHLEAHLGLSAPNVRFDVCQDPEQALAIASRERVDALLVGPFDDLCAVPLPALTQLVERDDPPVFLLLGAVAWSEIDWESLPCAGVDAVLEWDACRGSRWLDLLGYNIARARVARRNRSACVRGENMAAAVARLAAVAQRAALAEVAVDAALALRARSCALLLTERDDLVLVHAKHVADAETRTLARCTLGVSSHPVAAAAQARRPAWSSAADGSHAALPLLTEEGVAGVLWVQVQRPSNEDRRALERLAEHVAQTCARTQQIELLHERATSAERLIGVAAHDLRSPLQVIAMGAGLLQMEGAVAPAKHFLLQRIQESADRERARGRAARPREVQDRAGRTQAGERVRVHARE